MKKVIIIIAAVNAVLIFLVGILLYLSEVYPFKPGDALFGVQSFAEEERINLTNDPMKKAERSFDLVERRLSDLTMVTDPARVAKTVTAFDHNLSLAIKFVEGVPSEQKAELYQKIDSILAKVEVVLSSLEEKIDDQALISLSQKIAALQDATSPLEVQKIGAEPSNIPAVVSARLIPFLDNDVDHADFPLVGGHNNLDCLDCHVEGEYSNTPVDCSYCHTLERDLFFVPEVGENPFKRLNEVYPDHFNGECSDCHTIFRWSDEPFNHEEIVECSSCHLEDIPTPLEEMAGSEVSLVSMIFGRKLETEPVFHYPVECQLCHQDTESWKEWEFTHNLDKCEECHSKTNSNDFTVVSPDSGECLRISECASCHVYNDHEENYGMKCTSCHNNYESWLPANVNHTGLENCYQCHTDDKPKQHSNLMCSYCHTEQDWTTIIFSHPDTIGQDCASCHQAPAGHSSGSCSMCHTMTSWGETTIFHTMGNCTSCHNAPANHFPDLCITCHVTQSWQEIYYSHDGKFACNECHAAPANHYLGECEDCHFPTWWDHIDFDHTYYTNCTQCHSPWPGHDWPGDCTECHTTEDWYQVIYEHSSASNCSTCHSAPTGHWSGQCINCHNLVNWSEIDFDHTGYTNCNACHPRPANHSRGQCSRCHTTETWRIYTPTPTVTETPVPTETPIPTETPVPTETVEPTPTETPDPVIPD